MEVLIEVLKKKKKKKKKEIYHSLRLHYTQSRKKFIIALDFIIPNLQNPPLSSSSSSRTHKEKNPVMLPFRLSVVVLFLLVSFLLPPFFLCIRLFSMRPNDNGDGLGLGLDLSRFVEVLDNCNGKECPSMDCWKLIQIRGSYS